MSQAVISAAAMRCKTLVDGTLQLIVNVEPTDAQAAFALFGRPGAPMALAALRPGHAAAGAAAAPAPPARAAAPKPPKADHALSKWVALRCRESVFWDWIRQTTWPATVIRGEDDAAQWVRTTCQVESRAELDTDATAAERLHRLIRGPFAKYMVAAGHVS